MTYLYDSECLPSGWQLSTQLPVGVRDCVGDEWELCGTGRALPLDTYYAHGPNLYRHLRSGMLRHAVWLQARRGPIFQRILPPKPEPAEVAPRDWQDTETRVTDPETGGEKGQKDAQLGSLDPLALYRLSQVAGKGASKYARYNFLKGYAWSLSYDAMMRHALKFWAGEDYDQESGQHHMAHAAWHALALLSYHEHKLGTDDRFTG